MSPQTRRKLRTLVGALRSAPTDALLSAVDDSNRGNLHRAAFGKLADAVQAAADELDTVVYEPVDVVFEPGCVVDVLREIGKAAAGGAATAR